MKKVLLCCCLLNCMAAWGQQPIAVGKVDDSSKNYHSADGAALSKESSDAELARSLDQAFGNDPRFSNVQVAVKHRRVVLTGDVDSKDVKRRAEQLAENTAGVREVRDHLKVNDASVSVTLRK
jgi:osmotically-inducible protein OsmY